MPHSAFLRAIIDSPDDDLPRLVFADYLDETGDSARAEFIRVQCELATLAEHDQNYRELEDREHELLGANERLWLPDRTRLREWQWRRGFVADIADSWMGGELAESLFALHPITRWAPARFPEPGEDPDADMLPDQLQARLKHVDFATWPWPWELKSYTLPVLAQNGLISYEQSGSVHLREFASYASGRGLSRSLTKLNVGGGYAGEPTEIGEPSGARFSKLLETVRLRSLGLNASGLSSGDLEQILLGDCCASFEDLDISDNPIGPEAYRYFERANPAMRLTSLDVSGTPLASISLDPLLNTRALESLTKLEINGCGSARRNMEVLANSKFWTQATHLRAHSGTIPASTLEPLCQTDGPKELRLLDLADNYLRTEGVRMLCDAPWVDSLTWLALSGNYLDDDSCEVLAKSGRFRNLRTLHLANNNIHQEGGDGEQITAAGVCALANSTNFANLRVLSLSRIPIEGDALTAILSSPHWRLSGLGLAGWDLAYSFAQELARSPALARLNWLDLSGISLFSFSGLRSLAESPYLSPLCELNCSGLLMSPDVVEIFRERLGPRFTY